MTKKYKKKFTPKSLEIRCYKKQERGGNWYGVYELPLCLSSEKLDYHLNYTVKIKHITFQDELDHYKETHGRSIMKKKYGAATGLRDKQEKRNEEIYKIYCQEKAKRVRPLLIPDIILGQLRKQKMLKKNKNLSDRQVRRIIKEQKQKIYLNLTIKRIRELGVGSKPQS